MATKIKLIADNVITTSQIDTSSLDSHFTGGTGVTYSSGTISIGQAVHSTDSPTFADLTLTGNLNITGDINSYNVTDLDVTDQTITLGAGQIEANSGGSGIIVAGSEASILWDETNTEWDFNNSINVTGTITAGNTGNVSSPTITFSGDTDTGIYRPAADQLGFATAGTNALTIDASQNVIVNDSSGTADFRVEGNTNTHLLFTDGTLDRVGINTNAPIAKLSVKNNVSTDYDTTTNAWNDFSETQLTLENADNGSQNNHASLGFYTAGNGGNFTSRISSVCESAGRGYLAFLLRSSDHTGDVREKMKLSHNGTLTVAGGLIVDTDTLYVDSTNNRVGIGTDNPQDALHVKNPTQAVGDAQVILEGRPAGYGTGISFQAELTGGSLKEMARIVADGSASWNTTTTTQDARLRFFTTNDGTEAERMTIMSNGGVEIGDGTNYGYLKVISNNAVTGYFDRRNGSGTILQFRLDDSSVGSIGVNSGDIYIASEGTYSAGLMFEGSSGAQDIRPCSKTGALLDGAIDLGDSSARFKDLYLSGTADVGNVEPNSQGTYANNHLGVYSSGIVVNAATSQRGYLMSAGTGLVSWDPSGAWIRLGGTATANQLDDYEEGTWTASIVSSTAGTVTFNQGYYTKIGNIVFANFQLTVNSQASGDNYVIINGPFVQHINNLTWVGYLTNYPYGDRRSGIIVNNSSGNNTQWYLSWSSNSTASTTVRGVIVYQTT